MPQSVQDLHEVVSDDEGEGHDDESIPVFDPDADDDTDSVIDALQRDLEGDAIPADTLLDTLGSDLQVGVEREAAAHSQPQRRRLVLVNSVPVSASSDHGSRESDTDGRKWLHTMCTLKSLWSPSCRSRISLVWP